MDASGLLVDLDGTLYVGGGAISGAVEAVERLKDSGISLRFVTNTTRKPRREVHEGLVRLGFGIEEREIITPARTAVSLIGSRSCRPLVDESLLEDLIDVRMSEDWPEVVLVGDLGEGFSYGRLNAAFRCLMDGAELIALQKNRFWRRSDGLALDAGPFVAALEYASGKAATVVGKPEESFFRAALAELGLEPGKVAMVGDDAESDVAGARKMGIKGIQVKTGKYRSGDESNADLAVDSFADLAEALQSKS
ncbi:MAG: TIGR01458 family HAD-type hydrolase [Rubrobacter sp.]|jgi:HAD superfamily hydrolase (TIGR01458 family)|nr:TIGR01458 family HAD-type hydrolase [Rubrobacter sp.]